MNPEDSLDAVQSIILTNTCPMSKVVDTQVVPYDWIKHCLLLKRAIEEEKDSEIHIDFTMTHRTWSFFRVWLQHHQGKEESSWIIKGTIQEKDMNVLFKQHPWHASFFTLLMGGPSLLYIEDVYEWMNEMNRLDYEWGLNLAAAAWVCCYRYSDDPQRFKPCKHKRHPMYAEAIPIPSMEIEQAPMPESFLKESP